MMLPSEVEHEAAEFQSGTIKVDDIILKVQLANTDHSRADGLMFQEELPYDEGMLFDFKESDIYSMWMLNMQFPLDLMWFDSDGNVVHIEENALPCKSRRETASCTFRNPEGKEAQYVLEVTSGFVKKFSISENSKLQINI